MDVEALYHDGLLKPVKPIDLADGEWVELEITRRRPAKPVNVVSLKGMWSERIQSTDEGDWVSDTVAEIRRETTLKLDRLAVARDYDAPLITRDETITASGLATVVW